MAFSTYTPLSVVPFLKSISRRQPSTKSSLTSSTRLYVPFAIGAVDAATPVCTGKRSTVRLAPSTVAVVKVVAPPVPTSVRSGAPALLLARVFCTW